MKKYVTLLLIVILLMMSVESISAGGFDSSFPESNPLANDLFSIVGTVNIPDNAVMGYPSFYGSSGAAMAYAVYDVPGVRGTSYEINYEGKIIGEYKFDYSQKTTVIPNESESVVPYSDTEFEEISFFNDGIIETTTKDGTNYKSAAGLTVLNDNYGSNLLYSYNMGYFVCVNTGEEYFHTAILDFDGNMRYYFKNTYIYGSFDDNGYATMTITGTNVIYIIKLNVSPIITVQLNGNKIAFDQLPIIQEGRTLVPLRAIFEALGADVTWNEETQTVIAKDYNITVCLPVGSDTALVNGEKIVIDVPAQIVNGRVMVPVRFIANCFGATVNWIPEMQRVELQTY